MGRPFGYKGAPSAPCGAARSWKSQELYAQIRARNDLGPVKLR